MSTSRDGPLWEWVPGLVILEVVDGLQHEAHARWKPLQALVAGSLIGGGSIAYWRGVFLQLQRLLLNLQDDFLECRRIVVSELRATVFGKRSKQVYEPSLGR